MCVYVCLGVYVCMYLCVYMCVGVYMYVKIYIVNIFICTSLVVFNYIIRLILPCFIAIDTL